MTAPILPELDVKCDACDGAGAVTAPAWKAYFDATEADDGREVPEQPDGPEEIDCGECDGTGRTLTAAGMTLAAFIHRITTPEIERRMRR